MNKRAKCVLRIETYIVGVALIAGVFFRFTSPKGYTRYVENSPSEEYRLIISGSDTPRWPWGADEYTVTVWENGDNDSEYRASMYVSIPNAGKKAIYKINWEQEFVEITFEKSDKSHVYYRLPLKECE
ncbi:MAG: hypothetical protein J6Z06_03375 [Lachnospiraceae bacterium]|nr:hypothetical protein [Lachnospiraceae bacterium]